MYKRQIISFVEKCKAGDVFGAVFEEGTWWVIFIGGGLGALVIGSVAGVPVVLAIGVVMLFIGSAKGKKGFGIFTGFVGAIYNGVTGYFGDILSYSRLMALSLIHISYVNSPAHGARHASTGKTVENSVENVQSFSPARCRPFFPRAGGCYKTIDNVIWRCS